ncbi:hypothetical protein COB55_05200 [Candidatus Wolfebacteria bacterium]|nr:MAG: hypothetical protein COB55_05200 [Candidatus Wolfebacteria bacterium]
MSEPKKTCPDCNVKTGKLHDPGCDIEQCPFCHNQLMSCGCKWIQIGLEPHEIDLNDTEETAWKLSLEDKGLIPFGSETGNRRSFI